MNIIPGENSKCKGPGAGRKLLSILRNKKEAGEAVLGEHCGGGGGGEESQVRVRGGPGLWLLASVLKRRVKTIIPNL